jgi:hypothetical protein
MSTGINIAPSSDLTVGTTAVTSGTNDRVFFQAGGVIQQDANFTYDNTLKRLGLKAVGTGASDIPLLIQNSAGTVIYNFGANRNFSLGYAISSDGFSTYIGSSVGNQVNCLGNVLQLRANYSADLVVGNNISLATAGGGLYIDVNGRLSVGAGATPSARLDVRAQGALSTDIAFRVRNSNDNTDLFSVQGNAITNFGGGTVGGSQLQVVCGSLGFGTNLTLQFAASRSISCINGGQVETGIRINHNSNTRVAGLMIGSSTGTQVYIDGGQNIRIGQGYSNLNQPDANATRTIQQMTGVAPTTSVADGFQQYSADVVAGNAAPHFRTEVGDIIKLYKQSSAGITTVADLVTVLTNLGLLA